jgi:hypothetical protein
VGSIAGLSAEILGPPRDVSFFNRMDPPANQRYLTGTGEEVNELHPFLGQEVKSNSPEFTALKDSGQPEAPQKDIDALKIAAESPASRLALALDSIRNNTSLVILFRYRSKTLFFPAMHSGETGNRG